MNFRSSDKGPFGPKETEFRAMMKETHTDPHTGHEQTWFVNVWEGPEATREDVAAELIAIEQRFATGDFEEMVLEENGGGYPRPAAAKDIDGPGPSIELKEWIKNLPG
jgi:hypothetical protein